MNRAGKQKNRYKLAFFDAPEGYIRYRHKNRGRLMPDTDIRLGGEPGWWGATTPVRTLVIRRPRSGIPQAATCVGALPRFEPTSAHSGSGFESDERTRVGVRVEDAKVFDAFAKSDEVHGNAELLGERYKNAAASGSVHLRHHHAGDADHVAER